MRTARPAPDLPRWTRNSAGPGGWISAAARAVSNQTALIGAEMGPTGYDMWCAGEGGRR